VIEGVKEKKFIY